MHCSNERPILFSGPMVRAILEGQKTQTRRVVKLPAEFQPESVEHVDFHSLWGPDAWLFRGSAKVGDETLTVSRGVQCPYGLPGDRLWVREAHSIHNAYGQHRGDGKRWGPWGGLPNTVSPDATKIAYYREGFDRCAPRWRPSIHMPRWASRITLEITDVRVERLQDITAEYVTAEGVGTLGESMWGERWWVGAPQAAVNDAKVDFSILWDSINAKRGHSWASNPWVWVVQFQQVAS